MAFAVKLRRANSRPAGYIHHLCKGHACASLWGGPTRRRSAVSAGVEKALGEKQVGGCRKRTVLWVTGEGDKTPIGGSGE
jgi:hypothetical protein